MAQINDLEICNYFPIESSNLIAIGWLSHKTNFTKGKVSQSFILKLRTLAKKPWQPFASAGLHQCNLCQFNGPSFKENLFIPYKGSIYVAPVAVLHYIDAHWYCPPNIFIEAVLACPEMNSMEYKKTILSNGGRGLMKQNG